MEGRAAGMSDEESEDDDFGDNFASPHPVASSFFDNRSRALHNLVPIQVAKLPFSNIKLN